MRVSRRSRTYAYQLMSNKVTFIAYSIKRSNRMHLIILVNRRSDVEEGMRRGMYVLYF